MPSKKRSSWIVFKLLIAFLLFGLTWSYRPVEAQCPEGAILNAVCVTTNECGNQSCDAVSGSGGSSVGYCQTTYVGQGCLQYLCAGGACYPRND